MIQGARQVVDGETASPSVDSEYRFYAAWYAVVGWLMLRRNRGREHNDDVVRAAAYGFSAAAFGRVLAIRATGRPHTSQQLLLAVEVVVAAALGASSWRRART